MSAHISTAPHSSARLFGIPFGELGLFASVLIATALGFITFFAVTFVSIFALLVYDRALNHQVGLDDSYKLAGLPAGILVLLISLTTLVGFWLRNRLAGQHD